jgi:D-amino-acid dehydrogenase
MKSSGDLDFHYEHKGLLMAYKHDKAGEQEWEVGKKAIQLGLKVENLTAKEVEILEPKANLNIKGAVYFHSDAHMTPGGFMKNMLAYLKSQGVAILAEEEVKDIIISNNSIKKVITNKQEITADEFVMAAGSWSPLISKKLGIKMLLQPGKGYRINVAQETNITIPAVLLEAKVAVTPMNGFTRFSGTMEIDKINHKINPIRVNAIANSASEYYKGLQISTEDKEAAQCGLRPVTPDGLPYIGKTTQYNNLTFATGHAMMGWSLGPATGKLVSEIISNQKSSLDLNPFKVQRRF